LKIIDLTVESSLELVSSHSHAGTRIEAPAYLLDDGRRIDQFGLEAFLLEAVLLDLTNKGPGEPIDDEDLEGAEEEAGLALRDGEAVILYTGWTGLGGNAGLSASHPYLSQNGAEFLEFKRPSIVGTDAPSLDPQNRKELPAHAILMKAGILVLESLCNLSGIEQARFRLVAFPLKLKASASPVRAAAIFDNSA
jgi:arylformamidase